MGSIGAIVAPKGTNGSCQPGVAPPRFTDAQVWKISPHHRRLPPPARKPDTRLPMVEVQEEDVGENGLIG